MAREGQGYLYKRHDMMMMMMCYNIHIPGHIYIYICKVISSQRPKKVGVDYSCIEYMRNIIYHV